MAPANPGHARAERRLNRRQRRLGRSSDIRAQEIQDRPVFHFHDRSFLEARASVKFRASKLATPIIAVIISLADRKKNRQAARYWVAAPKDADMVDDAQYMLKQPSRSLGHGCLRDLLPALSRPGVYYDHQFLR
jgi:hypothetical protein